MGKEIVAILFLIMLPVSTLLILTWIFTYAKQKKHHALFFLIGIWAVFIIGIVLLWIAEPYLKPMIVTKQDIIGTYVIDKEQFPGEHADWQYDNFKFTITENDELIFQSRIYGNVWKSDTLNVSYSTGYYDLNKKEYCNIKIRIHADSTSHHIIRDNPTLYRQKFKRFYYVFESEKFGNVFFKKGKWQSSSK